MKKIATILILFVMPMIVSAQALTERQLHLATLASLEAQGDLVRLEPAIREALNHGVTINEIKEAFSHLYAYAGFPRSLNALGVLQRVLNEKNANWKEGQKWERPSLWDNAEEALKVGTEVQTLMSGAPFNYTFCPQDDYYLKSHLFGDIFASPILSHSDRELVTVAALSSIPGVAPQLAAHKAGAVRMGNTQEQVDELCKYLSEKGLSVCDNASEATAGAWGQGKPNDGYAQYFIGNSYLNPIKPVNLQEGENSVLPVSNVTFEPGCRNNWHIHHGAHQILICVSGKGWYQEWGKPAIALKPGDIVDIPAEVKHWHGAQKDSWFQHLTNHVITGDNVSNEWLEPVTDEEYNKL